jgi:PleD family two-component response regulator
MSKKSICIIDPFENIIDVYRMILDEKSFEIDTGLDLEQGLQYCSSKNYSLVITDYFFPFERILSFFESIKKADPATYLLLTTSIVIDDPTYKKLFEAGVDDILTKPFSQEKLLTHIEKGFKQNKLLLEIEERRKGFFFDPDAGEADRLIFGPLYFKKLIRQEIKRSKRYGQPVSFILLRLPPEDLTEDPEGNFYSDLINLLRKSIREGDLLGRENGNLGIILGQTDEPGSKNLGKRLLSRIQSHPSFKSNPSLRPMVQNLDLATYTFPSTSDLPEFINSRLREIERELPPLNPRTL